MRELGLFRLEKRRLQGNLRVAFQYLKGNYRKEKDRLSNRVCSDRARGNGFKLKDGRFRLDIRKRFFNNKCSEILEEIAQRGGRCPATANILGQAGRGSEQPDLPESVPAHCREVGLDDL